MKRRESLILTATLASGALLSRCMPDSKKSTDSDLSFWEVLKNRRSVRRFKADPIPEEHITKIIHMARMAPTSGNQQPWKFLLIQNPDKINELKNAYLEYNLKRIKKKISDEAEQKKQILKIQDYIDHFLNVPACIVVLTDNKSRWHTYNQHDGPLAAGYLLLAARALGYGTVYATDSMPFKVLKNVCKIPDQYKFVCFTPIGIPEEWPETPDKKALDEFIVKDNFSA